MYLLDQGFTVAHTAFSDMVFEQADVIADTPVFVDFPVLLERWPEAKFVYLERPIREWLPSIRRLLGSMRKQWVRDQGVFEPEIRRCFITAFPGFYSLTEFSDSYLRDCYVKHKASVRSTFDSKPNQILYVDISEKGAAASLRNFCLGGNASDGKNSEEIALPHVNKGRRITYWEDVAHPNKIDSKL
ncbi:MAG: hypothetical protein K6L76_04925 [Agarilytica sp.]